MSRWKQYNPNPSQRNVGDCTIRALTAVLGVDWETAFAMTAMNAFQMNDIQNGNAVVGSVLRQHGFRRYVIPNTCPDCYTIGDFADDHPHGKFVAGTGNHLVAVIDGTVWDSWNSLGEVPIYYWGREEDGSVQ